MKRMAFAIAATALSAPALADHGVPPEYGYVGIHGTAHYYDIFGHVRPDTEDELLMGLQGGYRINDGLSFQLWWEEGDYDQMPGLTGGDLSQTLASVRWHFHDSDILGFEPYVGAAAGEKALDPDLRRSRDETVAGAEFGLQRALHPRLILDVGLRPTYSLDNERWDGNVYAGLNLVFGAGAGQDNSDNASDEGNSRDGAAAEAVTTAAATQATESDRDGDGVVDRKDKCPDTLAGAKVDAKGCHVLLKESIRETLDVKFATGGATVTESSMASIERVAKGMREYPETSLVIEGHTDNTGSADGNRRLSQRRADAVKAVLVDRFAIDAARITAVGKGADVPIADNGTAEGRARNRRVEAELQASRERIEKR